MTGYGIVGCGMMGQEHIRNIALLPGARIAAVCDPNREMREAAVRLAPGAREHESLDGLLASGDAGLDCIVVASPNHLHVTQVEAIAASRPLPILVEKPLYADRGDAARVAALESAYPAPIWVAMEYRYMPPIAAFLERAAAATGGVRMLSIREHRFPFLEKVGNWNRFNRNTGGTFVEKCCHFFDLMRLALEAEPVRVMASAGQAVNHLDERHDGEIPDILDHGYVIVDFEGGARAMLELCMFADGARYQEQLSAVGGGGKIEAFVPGPTRFWRDDAGPAPLPKLVESPRDRSGEIETELTVDAALLAAGDHNGATYFQHCRFLEVVRGERRVPDVSVADGRRAVELGLAAQRSAAENRLIEM